MIKIDHFELWAEKWSFDGPGDLGFKVFNGFLFVLYVLNKKVLKIDRFVPRTDKCSFDGPGDLDFKVFNGFLFFL